MSYLRWLLLLLTAVGVQAAVLPVPEMVVPKTTHPPTIDGEMKPGEWDRAAACTGFVTTFQTALAKIQSTAWITFDDRYIYVAFRNNRGEKLNFLSVNGRRPDDDRIVYDPANEIWITPPVTPAATYQSMINVYPAVLDVKMIPSLGYTSKAWSGKWEIATKQTRDYWTVEARAPISAFGVDHIADGSTWRALFATDILSDSDKFRAWAPGGAFADIARHGFLHFTDHEPSVQLLDVESLSSDKPALQFSVAGGTRGDSKITITARLGSGVEANPSDLLLTKTISSVAGDHQEFALTTDANTTAPRSGFCEITAKSGETILYHQIFPFSSDGFVRRPPSQLRSTPYDQAFGFNASYAPLSKQLLVKIDRYFMQQRASIAGGQVELVDPKTGMVIASRQIAPFLQDYSEFPLDLKELKVPVQTDDNWTASNPSAKDTRLNNLAAGVQPAEYLVRAALKGKDGKELASASTTVKLMGYQFSWMPNQIGISDLAIAPWGPVSWNDGVFSAWNKKYKLASGGIAESVTNSRVPQFSGPMRLEAVIDGRTLALTGAPPSAIHKTDAAIDFNSQSTGGALTVNTSTRAEFDGFVWNTMTVQPTTANVGRLSLIVDMPETEAPFFVTTSGGWSSYHGPTPDQWDSRESSLTSMVGNFVPYVFVTDSTRGFVWFADNTKGWRLDPSLPTQELRRHDHLVTLRVNFINKAGRIDEPMQIQYGWMVTPQKAQPRGWRGYLIGSQKSFPQATTVFWNDADWDVLWPYYSSPYPKNYEKSRRALQASSARGVVPCVGNIAHAIARYTDYRGRNFDPVAADWGNTPGDRANGDVARSRGPNDFQLFHFDRWSKVSGLGCLYFDENYLPEDWNYLTGGAWLMPDGRVQPGYSYLALREYNKRLRYMFYDNNKPGPNLWEHTTSGHAVYAWMPDISMDGENVEPVDLSTDYIEALPASRLRSIGMGSNLGSAPFIMCQACRHSQGDVSKTLVHQLVGWILAHDVLPEQVSFWPTLASELELWRDDVQFLPYWKQGLGITSMTAGVDVSAHVHPGNAVLWVVNENRTDSQASIRIDPARLGLNAAGSITAYDAENGDRYPVQDGVLTVAVPKRMWRAVRLTQAQQLNDKVAFVADFDHEIAASEAYGGRYPLGDALPQPVPGGRTGNGASLVKPLAFLARHHVSAEAGAIDFAVKLPAHSTGAVVHLPGLKLDVAGEELVLATDHGTLGAACFRKTTDSTWHEIRLTWKGRKITVTTDGKMLIEASLPSPLRLPGMGRGLEIRDELAHAEPAAVTFGPVKGGVLDDLKMGTNP